VAQLYLVAVSLPFLGRAFPPVYQQEGLQVRPSAFPEHPIEPFRLTNSDRKNQYVGQVEFRPEYIKVDSRTQLLYRGRARVRRSKLGPTKRARTPLSVLQVYALLGLRFTGSVTLYNCEDPSSIDRHYQDHKVDMFFSKCPSLSSQLCPFQNHTA